MVIRRIVLALLVVFFVCMWVVGEGSRRGTDDRATEFITAQHQSYHRWFPGIWTSPDETTEKLLFALQGASGCFLGSYCLYHLGRTKKDDQP